MARSHESLWLAASAAFTAVAVALLGVNATFDAGRPHYTFWTSGLMVIVYVAGALAIVCFAGAMRQWTVPLSGDRPHRGAQVDPAQGAAQLAEPDLASADLASAAPGPVITDRWRQTSDGGQVPALMSLTHTVMFHPGYGGRQTADTPPSVKIGMLVACQPIDPAASGTELRAKFAAFLETEAVRSLIGSLTHVGSGKLLVQQTRYPGGRTPGDDQDEAPTGSTALRDEGQHDLARQAGSSSADLRGRLR